MNDHSSTPTQTDADDQMITALRSCGFFVRTSGLLDNQRPQVLGHLDNAFDLFKLTIAGADAFSAEAGFAPYLKDGETPLQRLQREIADSETLAAMLAAERAKVATAGQAPARAKLAPNFMRVHGDYLYISRSAWFYPQATEDEAGLRDDERYEALGCRDGDIVLCFKGAHIDAQDVATMLNSWSVPGASTSGDANGGAA